MNFRNVHIFLKKKKRFRLTKFDTKQNERFLFDYGGRGDGGTGVGGLHLEINRLNLERKSGFVKSVRPVEKLGCLKL